MTGWFAHSPRHFVKKIVSGGQTGADRAALDAARQLQIPIGGWLPHGRWTEDGPLDATYPLQETRSADPRVRTERNVRRSDATLIFAHGPLRGGTALTRRLARTMGKPCLTINLQRWSATKARAKIIGWLHLHQPATLNVAGPRASRDPLIYKAVLQVLLHVFAK